ncbi:MAG: 5-deoxy-glucuronate isomerase [Anaerolineales bacterium]|nr:5-deoxy-glucuronate isomerase [Anaerolineales bacterium]
MTPPASLLVSPDPAAPEYVRVTPASAGWNLLHFAARRLRAGQTWPFDTGAHEFALVVLGGVCAVASSRGEWPRLGRRPHVFAGLPYALYLPRRTTFTLTALDDQVDLAYGWCATDQDHPAALITPAQSPIELRGGGNASRQINGLLLPGFDCHRLIVVEVYTPAGNWSSYPPHKHDVHRLSPSGAVLEADLEEVYFYKFGRVGAEHDPGAGYAYQQVYTRDGRLNHLLQPRHDDVVLVPEGYHPVAVAPGYHGYYLNFLAGSAQSLANADDPALAWVRANWPPLDPRLPLVSPAQEPDA